MSSINVGVFCGARSGGNDIYYDAADALGRELAARGMGLVYGGGKVGLMGVVADAVLDMGGEVLGVIPDFLTGPEVLHEGVTRHLVVDDLFERKALMIEHSDAFIAMPGGVGTLDELLEVVAWRQLKQLRQPIGLLNVNQFFAPLLEMLGHGVSEGFIDRRELDRLVTEASPERLLDRLFDETDAP